MSIFGKLLRKLTPRRSQRRGFTSDERGTTAVEFGLLGVPFFAVLAAILETSYVFLAGQILDTAVQDSARFIRTGQLQNGNYGAQQAATFKAEICDGLHGLFDCSKLWISVETVSAFTGITRPSPVPTTCTPTDCGWTLPELYQPGTGGEIVLVRVYYKWPTFLDLGDFTLQNVGSNRLLGSVRVFSNEPFGS